MELKVLIMMRCITITCLLSAVLPVFFFAQGAAGIPASEPRYVNTFYALDSSGKLIDLEHKTATLHAKTKALPGYATVKMLAEITPAQSPVRLEGSAQFVVKGRSSVDPASLYVLRMLKRTKSRREIEMSSGHGTLLGATHSIAEEKIIPLRFHDYGQMSYRIEPESSLEPGEYGFSLRGIAMDFFCFSVNR
jgi:hypothetical protein